MTREHSEEFQPDVPRAVSGDPAAAGVSSSEASPDETTQPLASPVAAEEASTAPPGVDSDAGTAAAGVGRVRSGEVTEASAPAPAGSGGGGRVGGSAADPTRMPPRRGAVAIAVLLALLGFSLVVQVKSISTDSSLATTRQEDLVRILSDLEAQEERLRQEIAELEESQRQLTSGVAGRQAALEEATRQADELGILAGTLPATGPGLAVRFASDGGKPLRASTILDAVQELRGAGAEAMQITGANGVTVRVVASTAFLDVEGGLSAGGKRLTAPYTIAVIGEPNTMRTALNIPGGVVASVRGDGGNVTIEERAVVDVSALAVPVELRHARPVS